MGRRLRSKAAARDISEETYTRVMRGVQPDMTGVNAIRNQPEFNQQLWQYLNRAASDWRIEAGKVKRKNMHRCFRALSVISASSLPSCSASGALIRIRRSPRREEPYASCHSVAGDARLG